MKKKAIFALACACVLLFSACDKDDNNNYDSFQSYDPLAQVENNKKSNDSNAWWEQYTTEQNQKQNNKKTSKNNSKDNSKDNSKNNSKTNSNNITKANSNKKQNAFNKSSSGKSSKNKYSKNKSKNLGYEKVNNNTMKFKNVNGGTTTLTKDPNNKFIKNAISRLSKDLGEKVTAGQMMSYSDTSGINVVFIYTSRSSKNASTLKYVTCMNSKASPLPYLKASDGSVKFVFFPYATSGGKSYNEYRKAFKIVMDEIDSSAYSDFKSEYKSLHNDTNVKTFLSW